MSLNELPPIARPRLQPGDQIKWRGTLDDHVYSGYVASVVYKEEKPNEIEHVNCVEADQTPHPGVRAERLLGL